MPNTAQLNFKVTNLTQVVGSPLVGINYVIGRSLRGPFAKPEAIINSWPEFVRRFGGLMESSIAPLECKRLLEKGGKIRFCRVGHYTDPTNSSTLDAVKASILPIYILTFDSALVALNNIDLDINGEAIATTVFTDDNDNTLSLLAASIEGSPYVLSAQPVEIIGGSNDNRQILITALPGNALVIDNVNVTLGASQAVGTVTNTSYFTDIEGNNLFRFIPKYEGADYNRFVISVKEATNGTLGFFNISIEHLDDPTLNRLYENLSITGNPSINNSNYLSDIAQASIYFDVEYADLSSTTGQIVPLISSLGFLGGSDGSEPVAADYIGDSNAQNGFHSFDAYDDSMQLAVLDNSDDSVHNAGIQYASNRGDLIYYLPITNSFSNRQSIIAKKDSLNINNKHVYIFTGGTKVKDLISGNIINTPGIADLLAVINKSDQDFGVWYSFAGSDRGQIGGVLGVVNNFGTPAMFNDLNALANKQINAIINRDFSVKVWGNFSGQLRNDQEKYISIVRLIIYLKKALRPVLEPFLEEPNDIPTWKRMYYTVKPFLDGLVTSRALYSYEWQGDQFANGLDDLQINNATDVMDGKYKVKLPIKAIPSIQDVTVEIILTPAGLSFQTVSQLT